MKIKLTTIGVILLLLTSCAIFTNGVKKTIFPKILADLATPEEQYQVNPVKISYLNGKEGTRIIIPANSFKLPNDYKKGDEIQVGLTEIIRPIDFLTCKVPLTYKKRGKQYQFESAGMFRLTASYQGKPLTMAKRKKIEVKFPDFRPGEKFRVYHRRNNRWIDDGHNQEDYDMADSADKMAVAAPRMALISRIYSISKLGWWNFDYPENQLTGIKGRLVFDKKLKNESVLVVILGLDRIGNTQRWVTANDLNFKLNTFLTNKVKVIAISESGYVGFTEIFRTSKKKGTYKKDPSPNNHIQDLSEIKMKKVSPEILSNRNKLSDYLKLPREFNLMNR